MASPSRAADTSRSPEAEHPSELPIAGAGEAGPPHPLGAQAEGGIRGRARARGRSPKRPPPAMDASAICGNCGGWWGWVGGLRVVWLGSQNFAAPEEREVDMELWKAFINFFSLPNYRIYYSLGFDFFIHFGFNSTFLSFLFLLGSLLK